MVGAMQRLMVLGVVLGACMVAQAGLIVDEAQPWQNLVAPGADAPGQSVAIIDLHAARNEYEVAALNVFNDGDEAVYLKARVNPAEGGLEREQVVLREAVHVRNRNGALVADALSELRRSEVLTVPAGEHRQLWVQVHTGGLSPGLHAFSVHLRGAEEPVEVSLRLHVWNFELPDRMPVAVFNWDYEVRGLTGETRRKYLRAMVEHGVNVFHLTGGPRVVCNAQGEMLEELDFSEWDELIALEKPHARMFLFENWQFRGNPFRTPEGEEVAYLSEPWKRAFETWLTEFIAYTKSRGLDYEDWAFYPFDEYIGPKFVGLGKEIRRIDPQVLIFTDRAAGAEEAAAAAPYADIWCPVDQHFTEKYAGALEIMYESGEPVWFYFCGRHQKAMPPLERYRLMGWKTFARGLEGCTYWNIFGRRGSTWDDFDGEYPDSGSVYTGADGQPIPSRRWEAFREGLEDYCYLWMLRERIDEAPAGADVERAERTLLSATQDVLDEPKTSDLRRWRRRIASAIVDLGREQQ